MTAFVAIVCVLFISADLWRSLAARTQQLDEMTTASSNLARAMAQHADDTFKEADIIVAGIVERVQHDGTDPAAIERLHKLLVDSAVKLPDLSQINSIYVFDESGDLVTDGRSAEGPKFSNADREDFIFHRTHEERGPHIGAPLVSKATGKWIIPLSRRVNAADGRFAGVVLAAIDVDFFSQFYQSLDIGRDGAVALVRDDGIMILRRPFETRFVGKGIRNTDLFRAYQMQGHAGTFFTKSSQDGVTRLNSFRSLQHYPLFVAAALSKDEILAGWWADALWNAVGVGVLVVALALFGRQLIKQVSLQAKMEKDLAASLETTHAILNTATNPIITIDRSGKVRSFNPAGERVFGYTSAEIAGRNIRTLVPESHLDAYNDYTGQFARGGLTEVGSGLELAGLRKGGAIFPAYVSTGSMFVAGELCFVCVITDMTQQEKQRAELAAARDQLLLAADTAELGIWHWNLVNDAVQWNARMFDIYQQPKSLGDDGLCFNHWRSRVHPDDIGPTLASFNEIIAGRDVEIANFRIILPGGKIRHIQTRAKAERDGLGHAIAITGINQDVTNQQELELRLRGAKEQSDAASAAKSSFLANMSHEIRTPMNAVLGMLHLVQLTALNGRQLDYVSKAETAAKSLLGLLNDILDYSKIEAGKLQLESHAFELEPLMRDLGIVLSGNQGQKDVEVLFDIDAGLPARLIGDSLRLQQILINLAGNALKFTSRGQVVVSIELLGRAEAAIRIRVSITDSGIGISADHIERIFEGFSQAETSTTRRFGGSGLGLAICKRLIRLMGGDLKVESRVGVGSRFWFDISLGLDANRPTGQDDIVYPQSIRLLVVDDNPMAGELLVRTALSLGWEADYVSGGVDAVKRISETIDERDRYDAVVMDWRMPDLDGLNAAKLIRVMSGRVRPPVVVMITAYGREVLANAHEDKNAPFAGFLTKPVTPKQLAEAVHKALSNLAGQEGGRPVSKHQRSHRLAGLCLLVVEDNALNRQVAEGLLRAEGAEVLIAENGLEGVDQVIGGAQSFDAVLMDIQMPDIDGFEATRRIRDDPRFAALPIVAMTANASNADREACLKAGMNGHVGKPINLDMLVSTILEHVGDIGGRFSLLEGRGNRQHGLIEDRASIAERFGGNFELVERVLDGFEMEIDKLLTRLKEQVASANFAGAAAIAHTIKGSAGTVGARLLSMRAGQLEHQLTHGEAATKRDTLTPECVLELESLLKHSVEQLTTAFKKSPATISDAPPEPLTLKDWQHRLKEILSLLDTSNLQAIAAAEALSMRTLSERRGVFEDFLGQVRKLEFKQAALQAREMLEDS